MNRQPKAETLRRHYENSMLTDHELVELAEWLRVHYKLSHVSPGSKILAVLIAYKEHEKELAKSQISYNSDEVIE